MDLANSVITSVISPNKFRPTVYNLDGPDGSGKTFAYNYSVAELHSREYKVAIAACTGIAATLLIGGCTVHSLFKLLLDNSSCDISPTSNYAAMLRGICLFVVDESSMVPVYAFDAIDGLLRDITGPFGGKILEVTFFRSFLLCAMEVHLPLWKKFQTVAICCPI